LSNLSNPSLKQELIQYLAQFTTEHKRNLIEQILERRTRYITVVLEDIYQSHNASAVLRSCECFGVQDIHLIEKAYTYHINADVTQGASKWISLKRYRSQEQDPTEVCLENLRAQGYCIVATTLCDNSISIHELTLDQKLALCFGTEEDGLSDRAHNLADVFVKIPMRGFTQSLNISVSAAICLFVLTSKLHTSKIAWPLSEEEKTDLRIEWLTKVAPRGKTLERHFVKERGLEVGERYFHE
jgi:tRNA (guanosine-2'-O-)-methyltransferase